MTACASPILPATNREVVWQHLADTPGFTYTVQEVADVLELPTSSVSRDLRALCVAGRLHTSGSQGRGSLATYWWQP